MLAAILMNADCQAAPPVTATAPFVEPVTGQLRSDAKGIEQVWVPAGSFMMGTDAAAVPALQALNPPKFVLKELASEQPQHEVRLTNGYWIDSHEVTNEAFGHFVESGGYRDERLWSAAGWQWLQQQPAGQLPRSCEGNLPANPVACVSWYEADAYARWRGGRLPTEAEWEFAARGFWSLAYPWGNEFDTRRANVVDSVGLKPVGSLPQGASWVGALDMAGNVMEWVQDWLGDYGAEPIENPAGPASGTVKVEKGGWWGGPILAARAAYRHFEDPPEYGDHHIGFRVVTP